jgi:preprotein translocase subunit SecE
VADELDNAADGADAPGEPAGESPAEESVQDGAADELEDAADEIADSESAGPLSEAEAIAASVAAERPVRKQAEAKGKATPKQRQAVAEEKEKRTGPIEFVRQSIEELKKVNWPSLDQWRQYFLVVLVFVLAVIAYVSLIDLGFGALILQLFGGGAS